MEEQVVAKEVAPETSKTEVNPNPDHMGKVSYKEWQPLYKHFQLEDDTKHSGALSKIWEWAKSQAPNKDNESIIFEVIKLNNKLGSSGLGDMPYSKMLNYVTTWNRFKESEAELKKFEGSA